MIFVFGNEKGGVGKTSLARQFAATVAAEGFDTVLIDTDTNQSQIGWARGRAKRGEPALFEVIGASTDIARVVARAAKTAACVVVDIGAGDYNAIREVAEIADVWIVPTGVGADDLASTKVLCKALENYGAKRAHGRLALAVLINAVPGPWNSREGEDAREDLAQGGLTAPILANSLRDRKVWRDSRRANLVLGEMPPAEAHKAVDEFERVFKEITELAKAANLVGGQS